MIKLKQSLSKIDKDKIKESAIVFLSNLKEKVSIQDLEKVNNFLPNMNKGVLQEVWTNVGDLWAYVNNKEISIVEKTLPLAALVYVISPIDTIPDGVPIAGLIDDASIISFICASIASKLAIVNSNDSSIENVNNLMSIEGNIGISNPKEKLNVLTSILTHAAYADGEMSSIEEEKLREIVDFFVFSEEGWFSTHEDFNKEEICVIIEKTIKQPLSLKQIIEFVNNVNEDEEQWYFYAYAVVACDDEINASERDFLDLFAEKLNISKFDVSNIERSFEEVWTITVED